MTHLMSELAQARMADLHREAALRRRAVLVPRARRRWRRSLRPVLGPRPWRRTISQPARPSGVSESATGQPAQG